MSAVEAPKVEQAIAPEAAAPIVTETAPVETAPVTEAPVEAAAVPETSEAVAAEPVKEEAKPVEAGILGYKEPGLLKMFMFKKHYFWFGSEPVESKALTSYLRGEKQQELANKNVAWSASTGKGLLYFSKKDADKTTPAGLFNLSEISEINEVDSKEFSFISAGHKHIFQADNPAERENWITVLREKSAEAKELAPTVVESEEYKKAHADLLPKAPVVAAAAAKEEHKEEKAEEKAIKEEKKEEKKEIKEEKKEEKKESRKSRSASRKRTSIFGNFNLGGKKEEKVEAPKEEAVVAPTTEEAAAPVEPVVAPEVATEEASAPVVEAVTPATDRPTVTKRSSIFGNLKFGQSKKEKTEAEAAPVVPAKDAEIVGETAPVIPAVEASEPLATSVASPATVPTETTELPATNGETKVDTPTVKADKRKSSLPFFTKKEKVTSEEEGEKIEKPKSPSPFAKLRATVKGKSSPKAEKVTEKPTEPIAETPAVVEPLAVTEPEPVVSSTTPQVAASA